MSNFSPTKKAVAKKWLSEMQNNSETKAPSTAATPPLPPSTSLPTNTTDDEVVTPGRSTMVEPKDGLEHAFTYYYGMLIHQQNMLQDHVRTGTYQRAVMENKIDFKDKVIVDVGTGTGLLAIFAAQAGARKVYAVEASNIAEKAVEIVAANGYADVIEVIKGKIEEVDIPEKVDLIISEPMGFMLLHERMLEVFALAREKWGKPNCKMFPTTGTIYIAPFCDRALFKERQDGASFWNQSVYGVSLNALESKAQQQLFAQPIVGYFSPEILLTASGKAATHIIDFSTTTAKGLEVCEYPFEWVIDRTELMHGYACWFDVKFFGSSSMVCLTTSPRSEGTHWYQSRCLFTEPVAVNKGQLIKGTLSMIANEHSSFQVVLKCEIDGCNISATNVIELHDQHYEYLQQEY
jgi:histone-arginine methyltransferase CARM1